MVSNGQIIAGVALEPSLAQQWSFRFDESISGRGVTSFDVVGSRLVVTGTNGSDAYVQITRARWHRRSGGRLDVVVVIL